MKICKISATTMRFKITSQKAREKVIKRGMWNIDGVPMVVKKWTPKTEEENQEEEAIPMWVHLRKVSLHMFSWEALSFMTSAVGFPVRLHPQTIACSNFEEAKVFVNVDVSKSLPKDIDFTLEGKEFTAEFYYPWLPSRCNSCEKWGHTEKVCVVKKRGKQQEECEVREGNINIGETVGIVEKEGIKDDESQVREGGTLRRGSIETSENKEVKEDTTSEEDKGNIWALVSPDKIGRVQSTPQRELGGVHISASKYSVLSLDEAEEGEILQLQGHEGEEQVNEEIENTELLESDLLEDEILRSKEKDKTVMSKGGKRVQKTKALEVHPKGKRSSRRNL